MKRPNIFYRLSSVALLCPTLCDPVDCSMPGFLSFTISWSLLKLISIESVMPSNHLILCLPLLLQPSIFPSIMVFSNESVLHIRWPKYWSFCREPAWGIPPVTRSCGRKPDKMQGCVWLQGFPLEIPEHPPPRPESACFTMLCFLPTLLSLTGHCPPTTFFLKKLALR